MTPEQIEQSVYHDLMMISPESGVSIRTASANAHFLYEAGGLYYFYVPATGTLFSVEQDGNYYHGYEIIVRKCSKEEVLQKAQNNLDFSRNMTCSDKVIAHWQELCVELEKLP